MTPAPRSDRAGWRRRCTTSTPRSVDAAIAVTLRLHRDDGEDVVVRAVQRVEEEQQPEAEHRQEVAVDGPPRGRRDHEVDDRQRQRRDEEPDRVVNPQPAEGRAARARHQLGHEVAHRVGQQREDQRADDVPARDVERLEAAREERRQELDRGQSPAPRTTKASIASGNSAHSSGWLTPASTSTQPGAITAKFQSAEQPSPERARW